VEQQLEDGQPNQPCQGFLELGLSDTLVRSLVARGYTTPTPIQKSAIPHLLRGADLLGIAQTGTGKTAAFMLPLLQRLMKSDGKPRSSAPRALVLTPTRELAAQVEECAAAYAGHTNLRSLVIYGGVNQRPQVAKIKAGIDVLVATPGRLLDLMNQGYVDLSRVEVFVLDEADRMLDMGFIRDVRKIAAKLGRERQTLLFSATMPKEIRGLADSLLRNPEHVEATPPATTVERIEQQVLFVEKANKRKLLGALMAEGNFGPCLVFVRTKRGANQAAEFLRNAGIMADAIHGNKSQAARDRALSAFREGRMNVLVATDIASRGIDVPGVTHVINFDLPAAPEDYVHRIGRTGRAGRSGVAVSFCDVDEQAMLQTIQKKTRRLMTVIEKHPFSMKVGVGHSVPAKKEENHGKKTKWRERRKVQGSSSPSVSRHL
jgi:ATP-dependent RNA helicase RhlE